MGSTVNHFDKILLEQEWYFLGSSSPYDSSMVKHSNFEIALDRSIQKANNYESKLFQPKDDCTWKFVLVTLPTDKNEDERNKEYMMQDAAMGILESEERRWKTKAFLNINIVNSLPDHLKLAEVEKTQLAHKQNEHDEQEKYFEIFEKVSERNFGGRVHSLRNLALIYGKDSNIFQHAVAIQKYKDEREGITDSSAVKLASSVSNKPNKKHGGESLALLQARQEYYDNTSKLLIHSKVYEGMHTFMSKYYEKDKHIKFKAGLIILRFLNRRRRIMRSKFTFSNQMRLIDREAEDKMLQKE